MKNAPSKSDAAEAQNREHRAQTNALVGSEFSISLFQVEVARARLLCQPGLVAPTKSGQPAGSSLTTAPLCGASIISP